MKRIRWGHFFENKQFTIALSIFLAVICWFVVVMYFDPESTISIGNVPVQVDTSNTQVQSLGLEVSDIQPATVSVQLSGKRYKMAHLTQNDITVTASLSTVTTAGTYTLGLVATTAVKDPDYSIMSINPKEAQVTFDKVSTKNVTLEAKAPNIHVKDGYLMETPVPSPETMQLQGPDQYIKQLDTVVLISEQAMTATASQTLDATIHFYAQDGTELPASYFSYQKNIHFSVTVPVYKKKTVPLTFQYKNAPSTLDTGKIQYQVSPSEITVAGAADAIDPLSEINLGYIDVREIDIGKSFTFHIPVPAGLKNIDNVTQATVSFPGEGWSARTMDVSDIRIINQPAEYKIDIQSQVIHDVKIVGLSNVIEGLTGEDLVATIDCSGQSIKTGTQTVEVTINIVSKDGIWAVGSYTCVIEVQKA